MSGYVRIHRTLIGHPAFRNDAEAMAFAWLVAKAQWKPIRVRYKERAIHLARGQLAISVRDFAKAMDRDKAWIERLLKRLKAETMIQTRNETGVNVVTVCNYGEYQADKTFGETAIETPRETRTRQAQDTEQVREEVKEGSEAKASSPSVGRGRRLPDDWEPKPLSGKALAMVALWQPGELERELAKFRNYWLAKSGRSAVSTCWQRNWVNWLINADERKPRNVGNLQRPRPNLTDLIRATSGPPDIEHGGGTRSALPAIGYG